jgi:hypothetical protein
MNNSLIIGAAIVVAALIVKFVEPQGGQTGRYQIAGTGGGSLMRIDTRTGDAWFYVGGAGGVRWQPFADNGGARP